jgi:hypothetical protein
VINLVKKDIPFFGDYTLRYGWKGLEALTTELDAPAFSDFDKIIQELGPKHLKVILWAGLIHKFPTLKPESNEMYDIMDEYLDGHTISELSEIVGQALIASGIISTENAEGATEGNVEKVQEPKPRKLSKS